MTLIEPILIVKNGDAFLGYLFICSQVRGFSSIRLA